MMERITVSTVQSHIDDSGVFGSNEKIGRSAQTLLDELLRRAEALKPTRA